MEYFSPIALAIFMATSFSLFISAAWTLIPHLVEHDQLGIAYGIVMSQKFFGCTVFTIAAGFMSYVDAEKDN
jgi:type IV secretory pathway TrbF-like protein